MYSSSSLLKKPQLHQNVHARTHTHTHTHFTEALIETDVRTIDGRMEVSYSHKAQGSPAAVERTCGTPSFSVEATPSPLFYRCCATNTNLSDVSKASLGGIPEAPRPAFNESLLSGKLAHVFSSTRKGTPGRNGAIVRPLWVFGCFFFFLP